MYCIHVYYSIQTAYMWVYCLYVYCTLCTVVTGEYVCSNYSPTPAVYICVLYICVLYICVLYTVYCCVRGEYVPPIPPHSSCSLGKLKFIAGDCKAIFSPKEKRESEREKHETSRQRDSDRHTYDTDRQTRIQTFLQGYRQAD